MIRSLKIRNYTLLKDVSIDFKKGFTVISGETGAGKSILSIKKIRPRITNKPKIDLIVKLMIFVLPELVFLLNCI